MNPDIGAGAERVDEEDPDGDGDEHPARPGEVLREGEGEAGHREQQRGRGDVPPQALSSSAARPSAGSDRADDTGIAVAPARGSTSSRRRTVRRAVRRAVPNSGRVVRMSRVIRRERLGWDIAATALLLLSLIHI